MGKPCVAVIREEGSNGDREMSVSLYMAGFEVQKYTNRGLINQRLGEYLQLESICDFSIKLTVAAKAMC